MTDTEMILWIQNRVHSLMEEKGVKSEYRLFKDSGLAQSTVSSLLHSQTLPTLFTLQTLCDYFGITLSQFFFDETKEQLRPVTETQWKIFRHLLHLTDGQQQALLALIDSFNNS